jgi:hypothetical protein
MTIAEAFDIVFCTMNVNWIASNLNSLFSLYKTCTYSRNLLLFRIEFLRVICGPARFVFDQGTPPSISICKDPFRSLNVGTILRNNIKQDERPNREYVCLTRRRWKRQRSPPWPISTTTLRALLFLRTIYSGLGNVYSICQFDDLIVNTRKFRTKTKTSLKQFS